MTAANALSSGFIERVASRLHWRGAIHGRVPGTGRGSRSAGSGEFDGHERWCPGDDLARLDLRAWLRFRQRWSRRYRDDSAEPLTVIIDGGPSMQFGPRGRAIRWLRELLQLVARSNRDPWREWIIDGDSARISTPAVDIEHRQRVSLDNTLRAIKTPPGGRGRVVMISDRLVIDDIETQLNGLSRLGEPIWIAPLLPEEISPGSWGSVQLEATGEPTWTGTIDRAAIRRYRAEFARLEQQLRRWLQKRGGYHVRIDALAPQELFFRPLLQKGGPLEVLSG
ncbi:MAG: DUF58 domain-containing protein [Planctomycetota bacterium]